MILCICDYGEVRSVAMRNVLRKKGYCSESLDTEEEYFLKKLMAYKPQRIIWMNEGSPSHKGWIGRDEWGNPNNKSLIKICEDKAKELGL